MSYLSFCYSVFGPLGKNYRNDKELGKSLGKAHMEMTPDAYIAWAVMTFLIVSVVALIMGFLAHAFFIPFYESANTGSDTDEPYQMSSTMEDLIVYGISFGIPICTFFYLKELRIGRFKIKGNHPAIKAKQRGKKVDLYLPHAASFVAALAASNATMENIFYALSTQKAKKRGIGYYFSKMIGQPLDRDVFPVIAEEAAAVYRDMTILGIDTLTAIQYAVDRAPSPWLAEFFQGISSTLSSGGNLKLYFLNSAERFMEDIKQDQKQLLEQLAIQAEMFVTVAVAMPIFLIIILIITVWISSGTQTGNSMSTMYLVIFAFVPLLHFFFAIMTYMNTKKFSV